MGHIARPGTYDHYRIARHIPREHPATGSYRLLDPRQQRAASDDTNRPPGPRFRVPVCACDDGQSGILPFSAQPAMVTEGSLFSWSPLTNPQLFSSKSSKQSVKMVNDELLFLTTDSKAA